MEILLWLAPAALATAVAAVLAGRAADREERERLRRLSVRLEAEAVRDADRVAIDDLDGVSAPRPITTTDPAPAEPRERSQPSPAASTAADRERRSA